MAYLANIILLRMSLSIYCVRVFLNNDTESILHEVIVSISHYCSIEAVALFK